MKKRNGFTLIELVVVIVILSILMLGVFLTINPIKQLSKTYDSQRLQDLNTIQATLDTYFNNHNCYPQSVPFGTSWVDGNAVIAAKVPQDPQVNTNGSYAYVTDSQSTCPQWSVTFSKLTNASTTSNTCDLPSDCVPSGWSSQWACKTSGTVNCKVMLATNLPNLIAILPTQAVQNPLLQFLFGNHQTSTNSCKFNYEIYPIKPGEMLAHLDPNEGRFMIMAPPFQGTSWYGDLGMYEVDVSLNPDFSGQICDANTLSPPNVNVNNRGQACQTILNFSQAYNWGGWTLQTFGNIAGGDIIEYPYGNINNTPVSANDSLPANKFWSNWQGGKTIYWRFRDWRNTSEMTPVHSDIVSSTIPQRITYTDWHTNYFTGSWDTSKTNFILLYG